MVAYLPGTVKAPNTHRPPGTMRGKRARARANPGARTHTHTKTPSRVRDKFLLDDLTSNLAKQMVENPHPETLECI